MSPAQQAAVKTEATSYIACRSCGVSKPHTDQFFGYTPAGNLRLRCKQCASLRGAARYAANPEPAKRRAKAWRENNRERECELKAAWRRNNPEKARASLRRRRARYMAKPGMVERARISAADYQRKHPEVKRASEARRRAQKAGAGGTYSLADMERMWRQQEGRCWWRVTPKCQERNGIMDRTRIHVDHRIPISRGGGNGPDNIVLSCAQCNMAKSAKYPEEFAARLL